MITNISFRISTQQCDWILKHQRKARCYIIPDPVLQSSVSGEINFSQEDENSSVVVETEIYGTGLKKHGFHIHEKNTIEDGCANTGAHFNPLNKDHGGLDSSIRHTGDMGNLVSKDGRSIITEFQVANMTLFGDYSIIGRTCIFHELEDDLGTKDDASSKINGNAGKRIACGVVQPHDPLYSMSFGLIILSFGIILAVYYFFFYKKRPDDNTTTNLAVGEVKNI